MKQVKQVRTGETGETGETYMFDLDEELPPPPIEQQQLLLQVSRHGLVTRLDQEVPGIVHVRVLLHPVRQVPEEVLRKGKGIQRIHHTCQLLHNQ